MLASSNEALETLTVALGAAGLVDLLNGSEDFTVFAPTDEAFSAVLDLRSPPLARDRVSLRNLVPRLIKSE